ncbi:hypothetical protein [Spirosoma sp. KCTC 42546]|uniref:hypothetical protein n=1 Tax=Spirosoma sp. KCTC 42546 TaxID=2520506 RepID=UPI00143D84DF|nr:hypothetical protein [Spirosoma sp. KCTC 42546]
MKKAGHISECFYHKKEECRGPIKQAHSLQKNGRLSLIEGEVNGQNKIYTFSNTQPNEKSYFGDLKPIGKGEASTFFGFCDKHDAELFSDIENHEYDDSDKHNFLHSYRSFAHSYHISKQGIKAGNSDKKPRTPIDEPLLQGFKMSLVDFDISKAKLDRMIEHKIYEKLCYLSVVLPDQTIPIACATVITPPYYYSGKPFNNHLDIDIPYSDIMLTVLPDYNQTIIIFACFSDDGASIKFLDEFSTLSDLLFFKAVSSSLISQVENTFFAPAFWNALGLEKQKQLLKEIEYNVAEGLVMPPHKGFYRSKINLFDTRLSAQKLGIDCVWLK